jgi:hypothetical protein
MALKLQAVLRIKDAEKIGEMIPKYDEGGGFHG